MTPLSELSRYLRGWANLATAKRQFAELLGVEVAQEICTEVVAHEAKISATAHKSETYDREGMRLLDEAQAPDSDGGVNITPDEAKQIRVFVEKSAELDHTTAEMATV